MHPIVLPDNVDTLVDLIDRQFPLKNLPTTIDAATIQRHFGARDVVDFLRSMQRDRDENAMDELQRNLTINGR